jgi:predicted nucleotidyltransferase
VHLIALDDLIRVKRHINRAKDSESLRQLMGIKRTRESGQA